MLAPPGRRRVGCGHSIRAAGVRLRDGIGRRKRSVVVEQPEQFQEEGTCDTLREDVGNHDGTASVAQRDDVASNLVAQELSGAQDVFGLLEGDGVERHLDGGLRVAPHDGAARHEQAKVSEELAKPDGLLGSEGGAKVLGLSTRERDRLLHLREPVERAAHEEEVRTAARELGVPTGVDEHVQRQLGFRFEFEAARFGAVEIDENAQHRVEVSGPRVGHEAKQHKLPPSAPWLQGLIRIRSGSLIWKICHWHIYRAMRSEHAFALWVI